MEIQTPFLIREILATLCFMVSVLFALISIKSDGREHFLRICALFLLGLVVLFGNSPSTYFASVFIVATAVTKLEFLQNLAAIIRGSKEYFEYQKETQSRADVKNKIDREIIEETVAVNEASDDLNEDNGNNNVMFGLSADKMNYQSFGLVTYDLALNKLEDKYGAIDRYPRFIGKNGRPIEFDGIVEKDDSIIIFEIKTATRQIISPKMLQDQINRIFEEANQLARHKQKNIEVIFVYVVSEKLIKRAKDRLGKVVDMLEKDQYKKFLSTQVISYKEIGLEELAVEMAQIRKNATNIAS